MNNYKPRLVPLTDPAEIASAERNGLHDVIAAKYSDHWYAETDQLEHWRKRQRTALNGPGARTAASGTESLSTKGDER